MANVSKVVLAGEDIDRMLKTLHATQVSIARRLGITPHAMVQWRSRGATTTVAVVFSTLVRDAIAAGDEDALQARVDALRQAAVKDGYDDDRVDEILVEVAEALTAGAAFEASTGAEMTPLLVAKAVLGVYGGSETSLADEVGYHVVSVQNWLAAKAIPNSLVRFWLRRRAAAAMVDLGDGADPLSRAIGDLVFDARYGGWKDDEIAKFLESLGQKFSRVPA